MSIGRLVDRPARAYRMRMDDPLILRIEAAIARVERAAERRRTADVAMTRRHAALKTRMAETVEALDTLIAEEAR